MLSIIFVGCFRARVTDQGGGLRGPAPTPKNQKYLRLSGKFSNTFCRIFENLTENSGRNPLFQLLSGTSAGFFLGEGLTILECPLSQKKRYSRLVKIVQPVPPFRYFNLQRGGLVPPFPPSADVAGFYLQFFWQKVEKTLSVNRILQKVDVLDIFGSVSARKSDKVLSAKIFGLSAEFLVPLTFQNNREPW